MNDYLSDATLLKLTQIEVDWRISERDEARAWARRMKLERDEVYQRGRRDGLWAAAALCNRPGYYGMRERILQLIREAGDVTHEPE